MQWLSAWRKLRLLIHRFFSISSSCIVAMWAAVPPKLIHPGLHQKLSAALKEGRCSVSFNPRCCSPRERDIGERVFINSVTLLTL
jgi:hypothetical protein